MKKTPETKNPEMVNELVNKGFPKALDMPGFPRETWCLRNRYKNMCG